MSIEKRFENVRRSTTFQRIVSTFDLRNKAVLDLGCGSGEHLVLFGSGSVGVTTNQKEVSEGKDRGLTIILGNVEELENLELKNNFDTIWANNFIEHILSPHAFLAKLRNFANSDTALLLGVPVIPLFSPLLCRLFKFQGAFASNHISFFTKKTLLLTVERAGWNIITIRPFIVSYAPFDRFLGLFAPHLYVVATKNDSFAYGDKKVHEWRGISYYDSLLRNTGQLGN